MNVIEVKNLSKHYKKHNPNRVFINFRYLDDKVWVLKNINFSIKKGSFVGIIGKNGAGKSTLIKILNKILYPTKGIINVNGKIASLIDIYSCFNNEFRGIDNLYWGGYILGMSKKEIDKKFKDIISFADLDNKLYDKLDTYSDGMVLRLAFSLIINSGADIFLFDEIIEVGDEIFKDKCVKIIKEKQKKGITFILVSHNLKIIEKYCDEAIVLDKGNLVFFGNVNEGIKFYLKKVIKMPKNV